MQIRARPLTTDGARIADADRGGTMLIESAIHTARIFEAAIVS
jgi:hypothetical protein